LRIKMVYPERYYHSTITAELATNLTTM